MKSVDQKKKANLTPKQSRFVDEYLLHLNATQAAIRAGYSEKTARYQASVMLTKHNISSAIQEGQKLAQSRNHRTMDDVLSDLRAIAQDAMQKVPDKDGNLAMINHHAAIKAFELEGKHYGGFVARQDVTSNGETIGRIERVIIDPSDTNT